jgi:hypothetical protein
VPVFLARLGPEQVNLLTFFAMSLIVEFKMEKTTLLSQENPLCHLSAKNDGNGPVRVSSPGASPDVPALRITELKTGIETLQHQPAHPPGTAYQELAAGKKLEYAFQLHSITNLALPAEYEVAAVLYYDVDAKRAESKPVTLKVIPVTPRGLSLVNVQGGWAAIVYGVSVNAASDPPQIVRYCFEVMPEGGVADARPVANANLRAAPELSAPPNNSVAHAHWIAWKEEGGLAFTHFDAALGALSVGRWRPQEPEFAIVAPLAAEIPKDPAARPEGAALLWVGDAARHLSAFQVVQLTPDGKSAPGGRCEAGTTRPVWMMTHIRSDGTRLVTYSHDSPQGTTLAVRAWPKANVPTEAKRLAAWPGNCLGGGALMTQDDTILGATLIRGPQRDGAKVELIVWSLDSENKFAERLRHSIPWNYNTPVRQSIVRLSPGGHVAALLADETGRWSLFDDTGGVRGLPAGLSDARLPLDVAFLNDSDAVLIAGQAAQGFKLMMTNGDPLPHLCG